jgi:hypothetical protein
MVIVLLYERTFRIVQILLRSRKNVLPLNYMFGGSQCSSLLQTRAYTIVRT